MTRRLGAALACALVLAGCAGGGGAANGRSSTLGAAAPYRDRANHLTATIPPGWTVHKQQLTTLADPHQVFAASTFSIHQSKPDSNCTPRTAIRELPRNGAMVWLLERRHVARQARSFYKPRPSHFSLKHYYGHECYGDAYVFDFRDRGRCFIAIVYLHPHAVSPDTRAAAADVLDSLRVRPAGPLPGATARLKLDRPPYMGIACGKHNSIASAVACDRVGLAVWPTTSARTMTASIEGRLIRMRPPAPPNRSTGYWVGYLQPAGLGHGPLALPRGDGDFWEGKPGVGAQVKITTVRRDGTRATARRHVYLAPGFS